MGWAVIFLALSLIAQALMVSPVGLSLPPVRVPGWHHYHPAQLRVPTGLAGINRKDKPLVLSTVTAAAGRRDPRSVHCHQIWQYRIFGHHQCEVKTRQIICGSWNNDDTALHGVPSKEDDGHGSVEEKGAREAQRSFASLPVL
ncbi:hypothetical protein E2320_022672 [Naja naja]|nr:hypothetical protein E2320_022672 [Naja naja]